MLYDKCAVQCVPCVQSGNGLPYPCAIYRYRKNQPSIDLPNGASINFMITRIKKSGTYIRIGFEQKDGQYKFYGNKFFKCPTFSKKLNQRQKKWENL